MQSVIIAMINDAFLWQSVLAFVSYSHAYTFMCGLAGHVIVRRPLCSAVV